MSGGAEVARFLDGRKIVAWLAQVARHAFIDYVRKQNRQPEQPLSEFALASLANPDSQPEEPLMQLLDRGLSALDAEEWALVESAYFQDRTHGELAAESGQTAKAGGV